LKRNEVIPNISLARQRMRTQQLICPPIGFPSSQEQGAGSPLSLGVVKKSQVWAKGGLRPFSETIRTLRALIGEEKRGRCREATQAVISGSTGLGKNTGRGNGAGRGQRRRKRAVNDESPQAEFSARPQGALLFSPCPWIPPTFYDYNQTPIDWGEGGGLEQRMILLLASGLKRSNFFTHPQKGFFLGCRRFVPALNTVCCDARGSILSED